MTPDPSLIGDQFRQAMRRLATTISIVTSGSGDRATGCAATAVMPVSADPPSLVVAINRAASIFPVLTSDRKFCVNLLADRHSGLVGIFSGQKTGLERFASGEWSESEEGLPVLTDAAASLVCDLRVTTEWSTHSLFLGEVVRIVNHREINPLIWVDGELARSQLN